MYRTIQCSYELFVEQMDSTPSPKPNSCVSHAVRVDHSTLVSDGSAGRERVVSLERLDEYLQAMSALSAAIDEQSAPSAPNAAAPAFDSGLFCRTLLAGVSTTVYSTRLRILLSI